MKKALLLISIFIFLGNVYSQRGRNLVLISSDNHFFTVYIDQQRINNRPMAAVQISGLFDDYYNVSIYLKNRQRPIRKRLYVPPKSEIVYEFYKPRNSNKKFRFKIKDIYPTVNGHHYNQEQNYYWGDYNQHPGGGHGGHDGYGGNNSGQNSQQPVVVYVPGYNGVVGCTPPVNSQRFNSMLNSIEEQTFSNSKLLVAKQIIRSNCITVNHLVRIAKLFTFDDNKLALAKYAYDYVYDVDNYYKFNSVFDFDKNIRELDNFIRNKQ